MRGWFTAAFEAPTGPQALGWPAHTPEPGQGYTIDPWYRGTTRYDTIYAGRTDPTVGWLGSLPKDGGRYRAPEGWTWRISGVIETPAV